MIAFNACSTYFHGRHGLRVTLCVHRCHGLWQRFFLVFKLISFSVATLHAQTSSVDARTRHYLSRLLTATGTRLMLYAVHLIKVTGVIQCVPVNVVMPRSEGVGDTHGATATRYAINYLLTTFTVSKS